MDVSIEDEKFGKSMTSDKYSKRNSLVKDKNIINFVNSNNNFNKEIQIVHDECFIDNKLKSLLNLKNKFEIKSAKKLSFLNLLNFSIRTNYFLYKSDDFSLIEQYLKSLNRHKK